MKVLIDAGRALSYEAAFYLDKAKAGDATAQARVDLLTPIVKSGCTDMAVEVASLGIQVHGGMGFIEETGAAQFYRDARILPIYEGTNGIQAADLLFRKTIKDQGRATSDWIEEAKKTAAQSGDDTLKTALGHLSAATDYLLQELKILGQNRCGCGSVSFSLFCGSRWGHAHAHESCRATNWTKRPCRNQSGP